MSDVICKLVSSATASSTPPPPPSQPSFPLLPNTHPHHLKRLQFELQVALCLQVDSLPHDRGASDFTAQS
jgi:hypothetical protein